MIENRRRFKIWGVFTLMQILIGFSSGSFVAAATSKEDVVFTDYQPAISEVVDNDGFKHPGVGL
ncbi:MAG TPA: hypothetical protein VI413_09605, partial [Paludibacter sp.]